MNIWGNQKQKSLYFYLIILIIIIIINPLLARFTVFIWQIPHGISGLYFAVAFMVAFTLWFGIWGTMAEYIGCFIGAGMTIGLPHGFNAYWSLADLWQVLTPLIAFKTLGADASLRTKMDFLVFLTFGLVLNNFVDIGRGAGTLALGGIISWNNTRMNSSVGLSAI